MKTPLEESIEHWERLVSGKRLPNETIGRIYCALCEAYYWSKSGICEGCPVKEKTGQPYCFNTPYQLVEDIYNKSNGALDSKKFKAAAKKELAFLKSLLPKK